MSLLLYGNSGDIRDSLGSNTTELEYSAGSIALAQKRSTNVINSYLEVVYPDSIPVVASGDVPEMVNTIATDLSVYFLKRDKHKGPAPLSDEIKVEYYDKNIAWLEQIRKGELSIPELTSAAGDSIIAPQSDFTPTFDESSTEDSVIDPDKLDDLANDKTK